MTVLIDALIALSNPIMIPPPLLVLSRRKIWNFEKGRAESGVLLLNQVSTKAKTEGE